MSAIAQWSPTRKCLTSLAVVLVSALLVGCGEKSDSDDTRGREAMPLVHIKLKNMSPSKPATARAQATKNRAPAPPPKTVGPVPPGGEGTSTPPGTQSADGVTVSVTFEGGPTLQGSGDYSAQGAPIGTVEIECGEEGGTATVKFADGQPQQSIPLTP